MLAAKGCEGPLGFSALSKQAGLFHPGRRGRRPFLLAKRSALLGPEWLEGKSGLETRIPLLSEPGLVSFLLGPWEISASVLTHTSVNILLVTQGFMALLGLHNHLLFLSPRSASDWNPNLPSDSLMS